MARLVGRESEEILGLVELLACRLAWGWMEEREAALTADKDGWTAPDAQAGSGS